MSIFLSILHVLGINSESCIRQGNKHNLWSWVNTCIVKMCKCEFIYQHQTHLFKWEVENLYSNIKHTHTLLFCDVNFNTISSYFTIDNGYQKGRQY